VVFSRRVLERGILFLRHRIAIRLDLTFIVCFFPLREVVEISGLTRYLLFFFLLRAKLLPLFPFGFGERPPDVDLLNLP